MALILLATETKIPGEDRKNDQRVLIVVHSIAPFVKCARDVMYQYD